MGNSGAYLMLAISLALVGCGQGTDDQQLGGKVTKAEAQALHDAAEMLEQGRPQRAASAQALQPEATQ